MTDFEKNIKREVTKEKFEEIRGKKYGGERFFGYTYGDVASWFVWNRDENGGLAGRRHQSYKSTWDDGDIYEWDGDRLPPERSFASRLTTDIVFLGLNMSGEGKPMPWKGFQNARGYDRLCYTFFNTQAEGAYFTDLIKSDKDILKNLKNPADGGEVFSYVKSHHDILKEHARLFLDELELIGAKKPLLLVFGVSAQKLVKICLDNNYLSRERFFDIVDVDHYASYPKFGDAGYKNKIREQLMRYISINTVGSSGDLAKKMDMDKFATFKEDSIFIFEE